MDRQSKDTKYIDIEKEQREIEEDEHLDMKLNEFTEPEQVEMKIDQEAIDRIKEILENRFRRFTSFTV